MAGVKTWDINWYLCRGHPTEQQGHGNTRLTDANWTQKLDWMFFKG